MSCQYIQNMVLIKISTKTTTQSSTSLLQKQKVHAQLLPYFSYDKLEDITSNTVFSLISAAPK